MRKCMTVSNNDGRKMRKRAGCGGKKFCNNQETDTPLNGRCRIMIVSVVHHSICSDSLDDNHPEFMLSGVHPVYGVALDIQPGPLWF